MKQLYCGLYHGDLEAFGYFTDMLRRCWGERKRSFRDQDARREENPDCCRRRDLPGMMLYADAFAWLLRE